MAKQKHLAQLHGIKIETADGLAMENNFTSTTRSETISVNSISGLFDIVLQYDKEFNLKHVELQ